MPTAPHARTRIVQSRDNARVRELRAALARPSAERVGLEGLHLLEEALRSGIAVQTIFVRADSKALVEPLLALLDAHAPVPEILVLPEDVLRSAVTTETPQGIAGTAMPPVFTLQDLFVARQGAAPLLLALAGLQDPGNVGTILRAAEAFGASGVLALPGTASVWNAKSLRASMGSAFRLPVVAVSVAQTFETLRAHGVRSLAAVAPGHTQAQPLDATDLHAPVALWIGNEGAGLAPEVIEQCDATVTIPCPGPVESLNAAIAAGVLLYEASRQRANSSRPGGGKTHPIPQ